MRLLYNKQAFFFKHMKNTTRNLIVFSGIVVFILGLVWLASIGKSGTNSVTQYSQSFLSGSGQHYDFGTIAMDNGTVEREFELKNEGVESVVINKVYTSCMCTTAYIYDARNKEYGAFGMPGHGGGSSSTSVVVNAGESARVKAVYDPAAHGPSGVGLAERSVYVETNSAQSPKIELSFRAMVTR